MSKKPRYNTWLSLSSSLYVLTPNNMPGKVPKLNSQSFFILNKFNCFVAVFLILGFI